MKKSKLPQIIVDSREKKPYPFLGWPKVRKTLDIGDYSLMGLENRMAVERKSVMDMVGTLAVRRNADRFAERMWECEVGDMHLYIVVEGLPMDIAKGTGYSTVNGYALLQKLVGMASFGARLWFCGDRMGAEITTLAILKYYWDNKDTD